MCYTSIVQNNLLIINQIFQFLVYLSLVRKDYKELALGNEIIAPGHRIGCSEASAIIEDE